MTDPTPLYYQSQNPSESDISQLRVLSILHYVWGGLTMAISCLFIFHIVIGVLFATGSMNSAFPTSANVSGATMQSSPQPPPWIGFILIAMGSCAIVIGWTTGILTIISGRKLAARKSRIFSMVVAGLNCLAFPLGTGLGVFTIIVLCRRSAINLYQTV